MLQWMNFVLNILLSNAMNSLKARLFTFVVRNGYLLRGKLKKEEFTLNTSIIGFRQLCERGAQKRSNILSEVTAKEQIINKIKSEWLIPESANPEQLILYVHGGGYVSGSCNDHRRFVSKFAKYTGITNLIYEYRLAPEYPFPAALDDSVEIYQWLLLAGFNSKNIVIAGESAGGGLTLALLLALKELDIPQPKAAVAISPWTDLTCSSASYRTKNRVSPAPINSWNVFSHYYVGDNLATNHLISPLFGNLKNLPSIFINSAVDDELYEDGEKFYLKAKEAGVDITFRAGVGLVHCYPLLAPMFREATEAMNEIVLFIKKHLM
jgi:epsilon-lactone hydrolase